MIFDELFPQRDMAGEWICFEMLNNIRTIKVLNSNDTHHSAVPYITENK